MPLIPSLVRQRQADFCEFEASLVNKSEFHDKLQSYREILSQKQTNRKKTQQTNKQTEKQFHFVFDHFRDVKVGNMVTNYITSTVKS